MVNEDDERQEAVDALEAIGGVSIAPPEPTMVELVGDLEESLKEHGMVRDELAALRVHIIDLKTQLAAKGLVVQVDGIYDDGGGDEVPVEQTQPIVPSIGVSYGPEPDGGQSPEEMQAVIEQSGVQRDSRDSADIVEQGHEGVEEDQASFANVLSVGYGGAVERGMADAAKKVQAANVQSDPSALPFNL